MTELSVVLPAYRENPEVVQGLYFHLTQLGCEVIVVDDGGYMELSIPHHKIPHKGYGYALKYGILQAKNKVVCVADSDGQHSPEDIKKLYTMFKMVTDCKMVIGTRWNLIEPFYRKLGRKMLNSVASFICSHYFIDLNSGMRVIDRDLAIKYFPILCDTFSFTTSITISMVADGYKIAWFPIDVKDRVHGKSTVKPIKDGFITLFYILRNGLALRTRSLRKWLQSLRPSELR